jgi:hypothetical protein
VRGKVKTACKAMHVSFVHKNKLAITCLTCTHYITQWNASCNVDYTEAVTLVSESQY